LIERAIRCARESDVFDQIVVSTDIDRKFSADVLLRPEAFATDSSPITDTIKHVLGWYEDFDTLALLQPTSPTRTPEIVRECVLAVNSWSDAAWTVSEVPLHYNEQRQLHICESLGVLRGPGLWPTNRQELYPSYIKNGLCYAVTTEAFHKHGLHGSFCRPILTEGRHVNIDTPEDLEEARRLLG
jgi:CMP-N-acetylneuraminic acid synthetase